MRWHITNQQGEFFRFFANIALDVCLVIFNWTSSGAISVLLLNYFEFFIVLSVSSLQKATENYSDRKLLQII